MPTGLEQLILVQLLVPSAICELQYWTGTLGVFTTAVQVREVKELPATAETGEPKGTSAGHGLTYTKLVFAGGQVVVTQKLPAVAAEALQVNACGWVLTVVAQVVVVQLLAADATAYELWQTWTGVTTVLEPHEVVDKYPLLASPGVTVQPAASVGTALAEATEHDVSVQGGTVEALAPSFVQLATAVGPTVLIVQVLVIQAGELGPELEQVAT